MEQYRHHHSFNMHVGETTAFIVENNGCAMQPPEERANHTDYEINSRTP
jgi:hypothetical protein